jgi:ubiquinone/menaquinone biosynthesis C-methylase UbiE
MSQFDEKAKEWDTPESEERAAYIAEAIRSQVSLSTGMSAFEYGAGTGQLSFQLRHDVGPVTLVDNSEGMLEVLNEKIDNRSAEEMKPVKLNLSEDPLPDERFDIIYTMMTLHHIPDTPQVLKQFYTLLNARGYLCIADLDKEDGSFHGQDVKDVHRGFDRDRLADLAEEAGFTNVRFTTAYEMEHEIDEQGNTGLFPIFLMTAEKA